MSCKETVIRDADYGTVERKEDKMLAGIYGFLAFVCMIAAGGFADGGSLLGGLVAIGLFALFCRLAMYESGMMRRKKNSPR